MSLSSLLLIFALAFAPATYAGVVDNGDDCLTTGSIAGLTQNQCVAYCNWAFENKSEKMTKYFEKQCEVPAEAKNIFEVASGNAKAVGKVVDEALLKCLPIATKKAAEGAYEFVTSLPYLVSFAASYVKTTMDIAGQVAIQKTLPPGFRGTFSDCEANADCRRTFARGLIQYQERNPDGSFKVDNGTVDSATNGMSLNELIERSRAHQAAAKRECGDNLANVRRETMRLGEDYDEKAQQRVYDEMAQRYTHCLGVLKLYPPSLDPACAANFNKPLSPAKPQRPKKDDGPQSNLDSLTKLEKIATGAGCLGEAFTVDFCSEIVQNLIPLPLIGPQTKMLGGAVKAEVAAAKAEASAIKTEANAAAHAVEPSGANLAPRAGNLEGPPPISSVSTVTSTARSARAEFTEAYKAKVFVNEAQNRKFMAVAEAPKKGTQFVEVENSVLKKLNDQSGDKNLVTSFTNLHKELLLTKMDALKAKYPGLQFEYYSDFKSVKIAVGKTDGLSSEARAQLQKDLNAALADANKQFAGKVKELGVDIPGVGDPEKWFRGGTGQSLDEAALAARRARQLDGENRLMDFASPEVKTNMQARLQDVESMRKELADSPPFRTLIDRDGPAVPRTDVLDLTRKYADPDALAGAIRDRYGISNFASADAQKLLTYSKGVDEFSPTILVPKREVLDLDAANRGGLTADFLGLGSANLHATARGVAQQTELSAALNGVRTGEKTVTKAFKERMTRFEEIAGPGVRCSGDDCIQVASRILRDDDKAKLLSRIAKDPQTRGVRMSFIGPDVPAEARLTLASQGELIEKALRKELEGKIAFSKLQKMSFGLDMKTASLAEGQVDLVIGRAERVWLTSGERREILEAFNNAVKKYGKDTSYTAGQTFTQGTSFRLVPGAGFIFNANGED